MLRYKSTFGHDAARRQARSILFGVIGAALILAVAVLVFVSRAPSADVVVPAPIESLGMQEWPQLQELSRQELDISETDQSDDQTFVEVMPSDPYLIRGKINKNQTLFVALKNHGLDVSDIHQVITAMQEVVDFRRTQPGDKYEVHLDADRRIVKFQYEVSPEDISIAQREGTVFLAQKLDVHKQIEEKRLHGAIQSSLYQAFVDLGESGELATHFMQLFKYDIDFGTDSQVGDTFSVLVEKITLGGKFYRYGRVSAATYESRSKGRLEAYYFDGDEKHVGYYDGGGRALRRTFLKTPVVGCTMTSPFDLKRMHPILKRVRPHYGIDWAGPTGTPVMAFADGTVTFAGWEGANGNLLIIEHAHGYTSLYAHLHGFARGIKKGSVVRQGQVVAMIGNTGISTGPHLHFGVKRHGKYIDPARIDATHSHTLAGPALVAFDRKRDVYRAALSAPGLLPAHVLVDSSLPHEDSNAHEAMNTGSQ